MRLDVYIDPEKIENQVNKKQHKEGVTEEESALHTHTYTLSGEIIIRFFFVIYPFFGLVGWSLTSSPVHNDIRRVPWMHAPEIVDYKNPGVFFFSIIQYLGFFWLSSSLGILKLVRQSSNPMWTSSLSTIIFVYNEEEQKSQ